jgi:hypothetical protein
VLGIAVLSNKFPSCLILFIGSLKKSLRKILTEKHQDVKRGRMLSCLALMHLNGVDLKNCML